MTVGCFSINLCLFRQPLKVVRKMYELRFGEKPPERRSVEQLRGMKGRG